MSDDQVSLKDVVARFLRRNPGFLDDYPDVLEVLQLQHQSGAAASLIERQVEQLRQKNEELNRQLNRLVHVASENEQLMSRLHQLTLELMAIHDPTAFFEHLGRSLLEDFKADILRICLFDRETAALAGGDVRWVDPEDEALQQFQVHLEKNHTVCGRLSENKLGFLFDNRAQWVQSTALVPLGDNGSLGMMAIGSSDPARFYPGMGTLFLDLLADVIASSLANVQPQAQRRSA
ncbi:DUF484 family protein [Elongatibacter sediminis]|uniref:DUF484 family protein n=1 Tax=Elongatibacter sediminis TaxID=3119006 RepID=A0AAW9R7V1_9GAMM